MLNEQMRPLALACLGRSDDARRAEERWRESAGQALEPRSGLPFGNVTGRNRPEYQIRRRELAAVLFDQGFPTDPITR